MSTILKTKNLGLITYEGEAIPTFLNDTTYNMGVIDEQVGTNKNEVSQLDSRMESAEDDIMQLREQFTTFENDNSSFHTDINERVTVLEKSVSDLEPQNIADIRDRLANAEADILSNSSSTSALQERVGYDEIQITNNADRIQLLEEQLGETGEYDLQGLKENVNQNAQNITALGLEVDNIKNSITGNDGILDNIKYLSGEIDGLQTSNITQANQIEGLGNQVRALEEKVGIGDYSDLTYDLVALEPPERVISEGELYKTYCVLPTPLDEITGASVQFIKDGVKYNISAVFLNDSSEQEGVVEVYFMSLVDATNPSGITLAFISGSFAH